MFMPWGHIPDEQTNAVLQERVLTLAALEYLLWGQLVLKWSCPLAFLLLCHVVTYHMTLTRSKAEAGVMLLDFSSPESWTKLIYCLHKLPNLGYSVTATLNGLRLSGNQSHPNSVWLVFIVLTVVHGTWVSQMSVAKYTSHFKTFSGAL